MLLNRFWEVKINCKRSLYRYLHELTNMSLFINNSSFISAQNLFLEVSGVEDGGSIITDLVGVKLQLAVRSTRKLEEVNYWMILVLYPRI